MLFSHRDVASDVERLFEPVWVSLRPVPQVTIDFGGGNVVRRTLHGNIATWICDAEGRALDVIPGIYTTAAYRERLAQGALLAKFAGPSRERSFADDRDARLRAYHSGQAGRMAEALEPLRLVERLSRVQPVSKFRIENPLEVVLEEGAASVHDGSANASATAARRFGAKGGIERPLERTVAERTVADPAKREAEAGTHVTSRPVANDSLLGDDVRVNETARRLEVHRLLAETGPVAFETLTKRLYRDVLHCDLDDPWLGLGPLLFGTYPFER